MHGKGGYGLLTMECNRLQLAEIDPYCVTQLKLYTLDKLISLIICCLYVFQGSVTPD